jgi:hypothetical protein
MKMTELKIPSIYSGKTRNHRLAGCAGDIIDYRKQFGEISMRFTNCHARHDMEGDFSVSLEIGKDQKNDEFMLHQETIAHGQLEKCCDEIVNRLSRYMMRLDSIRNDIKSTIDFLSGTMLGNGFLPEYIDLQNNSMENSLIGEAVETMFEEKGDE